MSVSRQIYFGLAVALFAFNISKITLNMELVLIVILAVALCVSLFFNYRLYMAVKAYQHYLDALGRKLSLVSQIAGFLIGFTVVKLLIKRFSNDEGGEE